MKLHLCLDVTVESRKALLSILRAAPRSRVHDDANDALDEIISAVEGAPQVAPGTMMQVALDGARAASGLRVTEEDTGKLGVAAVTQARELVGDAPVVRLAVVLHFGDGGSS